MTDPTPTSAEVEADLHRQSMDMMTKLVAENQALRERAEAAERDRDEHKAVLRMTGEMLTAARRAEAAAWNDAIEAAAGEVESLWAFRTCREVTDAIRALRRAAPTEQRE